MDGDRRRPAPGSRAPPGGRCDRLGCTATLPDGRAVALVRDRRAFLEDCARAAVLITGLAAPATCTGPLVIDRHVLAAHGAVALRAGADGFTLHSARADDRARPWRPHAAPGSPGPGRRGTDPPADASGGMAATEPDTSGAAPGDAPAEPLQ